MNEQTAQPGAPAAPAAQAPRVVSIPPAGRPGHEAAVAAFAERFPGASTEPEQSANGGDTQQAEQAQGEQQSDGDTHQFAPQDPIAAMRASRALSEGLQETGEIPGLDRGTADFYSKHLNAALQRPPITQAQSDAQQAETWRMLRQTYGAKADQMVEDARSELKELAKRLPNLPAQLDHTGGANEATIIIQLAKRHAERARARMIAGVRRR